MISSISETEFAEPSRPLFTVRPEEVEWSVVVRSNELVHADLWLWPISSARAISS